MGYIFAGESYDIVAGATRRASVNGPASIDARAFFMLLLFDAHTAVAVLYDSETQRELLSHGVVAFNGTGSRPFVVSRGGERGKYQTGPEVAHRRPRPTDHTCPMSRQQPSSPAFLRGASGTAVPMPGKEISLSGEKKSQKSLDAMHNNIIFAASKHYCGQNAAGILPAIFVPPFYRNQRITAPCRESGNRPGVLAIMYSTARSAVAFLCQNIMQKQKQIAFTRRKIALTFTLLNVNAILLNVKETCSQILLILLNLARIGKEWKARENAWFSAWCQEPVTNIEVLRAAVGVLVGLPVALIIAGLVLGGGAS